MELKDLMPIGLMFVISAVAMVVGVNVLDDIGQDQCAGTYTWNASKSMCQNTTGGFGGPSTSYAANTTSAGIQGLQQLGSWFPTLALILVAAIVIGVLVMQLMIKP